MKFNWAVIIVTFLVIVIISGWKKVSSARDLRFLYPLQNEPLSSAGGKIEIREKADRRFFVKLTAIGVVFVLWQGIWNPTNTFNTEKQLAEEQKSIYINSFESGWSDQCEALFGRLGGIDSPIYGEKLSLTYPQCMAMRTNSSGLEAFNQDIGRYIREFSNYDMREKGRFRANRDVLSALFKLSRYWCHGMDCISGEDFGILRP